MCHLNCFIKVIDINNLRKNGEVGRGTKKVVEEWEEPFVVNLCAGFQ